MEPWPFLQPLPRCAVVGKSEWFPLETQAFGRAGDHDTATGDHWDRFYFDLNHLNGEVMPKLWPDECIHYYCMDALILFSMQLIHPFLFCIAQITAGEDHEHEELIIILINSSPLLENDVHTPVMSVILF